MAQPRLFTYKDAVESCRDWLGAIGASASQRDIFRCIQTAHTELIQEFGWQSQVKQGRVQLKAAQTTGTITYDHTGGAYERLLTLADGTFPSWSEDAVVRIGDAVHAIEDYKSSTTATLDVVMNPGADVAAGTSYAVYPAYYHLPVDFDSMHEPLVEELWGRMQYVSPDTWHSFNRYYDDTGYPVYYTIMPVADLHGIYGLCVHPAADEAKTLDFLYKAKPRQLYYSGEHPGTICSAGSVTTNGTTTITGTSTSFEAGMVGSVIRIGRDAPNSQRTNLPTGVEGQYPFVDERIIHAVNSSTSITVDRAVTAYTGVAYTISDPLDFPEHLRPVFLRLCELNLANARNMESRGAVFSAYQRALFNARGADMKAHGRMVAGSRPYTMRRLSDGAYSADVN